MSAMETRKIQQVGGGTYTVSLPKEWATAADIEPGAVVALHSHIDGTLVVQTGVEGEADDEPLSLSVADADSACLERTLSGAYAAGIDAIELTDPDGIDDDTHRLVERLTRNLTGVTVTDSSEDGIRVRSLLDVEEVSITQSVRQLQFAALSAHRDATASLTTPTTPPQTDEQAVRIAGMVDHYFQRGLDSLSVMDSLGLTRPELFVRWVTARELERVAGHGDRIATVADRLDAPVDGAVADEFDELADRSRELVREAVSLVLDGGDAAAARRLLDERDGLGADIRSLDRRLFEGEAVDYRATHAVDGLRRTAESAGTIAEAGMRSLLRERMASATPGATEQ